MAYFLIGNIVFSGQFAVRPRGFKVRFTGCGYLAKMFSFKKASI